MCGYKVPLRDRTKQIIDYAYVSAEDYDNVMLYRWYRSAGSKHEKTTHHYARSVINGQHISMHHFLQGKPTKGHVVDHIDGNGLNNTRENLRIVTLSQNSQNRRLHDQEKNKKTSKYIGVSLTSSNKWVAFCKSINLGTFENEIDAARRYDSYALKVYGKEARCNNLVFYDDIVDKDINEFLPTRRRDLPKHIIQQNEKYYTKITYKGKKYVSRCFDTIDEAIEALNGYHKEINIIISEEKQHQCKEIERNDNGIAKLRILDKNKNVVAETLIDDDIWCDIQQYKLNFSRGYVLLLKDKKPQLLHQYIMGKRIGHIIDHINRNKLDNRRCNLRYNDYSGNNHNHDKKRNGTSIYKGVSKNGEKGYATIRKNNHLYKLGSYDNEVKAAIAYNIKAEELYRECANLNNISQEDYGKYYNSVCDILNSIG